MCNFWEIFQALPEKLYQKVLEVKSREIGTKQPLPKHLRVTVLIGSFLDPKIYQVLCSSTIMDCLNASERLLGLD